MKATAQQSYEQMAQARQRLLELLHYPQHRLAYRKRTELAIRAPVGSRRPFSPGAPSIPQDL